MEDKINNISNEKILSSVLQQDEVADEELLKHAIARLNGNILGIVAGFVGGMIIFIATNWLVLKGGANAGEHLELLNNFYYGYSVSFIGSLIGFGYAFVTGYIIGLLIAWLYNRIAAWRDS